MDKNDAIEIVLDGTEKESIWQEGWELYYSWGVHDPDHTVLRFLPMAAKYYHKLNFFAFDFREKT